MDLENKKIKSYNKKLVLSSITVINAGDGYQNKQRTVAAAGINTASNQITNTNHDYQSGEILKYTAGDTTIGGLVSGTEYYATKVDDNNLNFLELDLVLQIKITTIKQNSILNFLLLDREHIHLTTKTSVFL